MEFENILTIKSLQMSEKKLQNKSIFLKLIFLVLFFIFFVRYENLNIEKILVI